MTDPRSAIPDTVLVSPDGDQWLARSKQLIVSAERNQPPRIILDGELLSVRSIDADGVAQTRPGSSVLRAFSYSLDTVPPELAQALAVWMAEQAGINGAVILAGLYPALSLAAEISLTAQLALADADNGAAVPAETATNFAIPKGTVL